MLKKAKIILIVILALVVVSIAGIGYALFGRSKLPEFGFIEVERTNLVQEVSVTGKIKPREAVSLSFEKSGRVDKIHIETGEAVNKGSILASLDSGELRAQESQAMASLDNEKANLAELKQGAKPEEIALLETKVANAQIVLSDAQENLSNVEDKAATDLDNLYNEAEGILNEVYVDADDALNKQIDDFFTNDNTASPKLTFSVTDSAAKIDAELKRKIAGDALNSLKSTVNSISTYYSSLDEALTKAEGYLTTIKEFLSRLNDALNAAAGLSQTTILTYKGYLTTARTNINDGLSAVSDHIGDIAAQISTNQNNISTARAGLNTASNNLKVAEDELALELAGSTQEQIQAQEAKVKVALANLENIRAQLEKMSLRSPILGVVNLAGVKEGEYVAAGELVVSVISESDFQIECLIPEVDIAKVKTGDIAELTLDAYNDDVIFRAVVSSVDPKETIIEGVATYKTILQFTQKDSRIRSGMTANIDILTAQRTGVIVVPQRAVLTKNGQKIVRVITDLDQEPFWQEVQVQTGLRGSDGNIEIVSGLSAGDKVITFIE